MNDEPIGHVYSCIEEKTSQMKQRYPKTSNMKKTNTFYFVAICLAITMFILASCSKNTSLESASGQQAVSLYLTDGPGFFDKVNVDIRSVKLLVDTSKNTRDHDSCDWEHVGSTPSRRDSSLVWEDLNVKAGIYDILALRNGVDTLLASKTVVKGAIRLIRIDIGTNNSLVKDSVTYPLNLPTNFPGYVLIKLRGHEFEEFLPNRSRLWLDFDISRSIVQERNNQFYLRPWIACFTVINTASISGKVLPNDAKAVITVFNDKDTAYALPNKSGEFKLRGLKDGTYSAYFNASNGYKDTTITNIVVSKTKEAKLGTITLRK
ncbi:MAG: DUF4382 domain-containing protein [Sediminibacterium sp.]|nr:DUF4382 domain-containing protein [Sediminibacterium sp.]